MDPGILAEVISATILMAIWLSLVAIVAFYAIKKANISEGFRKIQFLLLSLGTIVVFIGDFIHTIGLDIGLIKGDAGLINLSSWGTIETQSLALFLDSLVFIFYYAMWALIISFRYQEGKFTLYDKIVLGLASFSFLTALFSPYINISGINYIVSIYSLHMLSFVIFGIMTVAKLIFTTNRTKKQESKYQKEEKLLNITGWGFIFSFLFFVLTLGLIPLNTKFGMFMIPKTFAYMVSFISLVLILRKKE
jgi:hypothetical protein